MLKLMKKLNPFRKKTDMIVGMQLTDNLIRFVGLAHTKQGVHVYLYGEEYLSQDAIVQGKIVNPATVGYALATIKKKYDLDTVHVVLPEEQSFIFHTHVTKTDESDELQHMIEDHIITYLKLHSKLSTKDLVCEYDVIGEENDSYELAVWVTPRSIVEAYVEVFESAGLDPETLEIGSRVVTEAIHDEYNEESSVIVDFGSNKTHITVESGGVPVHSTTLELGESDFDSVIQAYLDISDYESGRIKKRYGLLRSHKEPALLSELLHSVSPLTNYIDRLYVDWHTRPDHSKVNSRPITRIVLHGEGSHIAGLRDHVSSSTRIPADYINVWNKVHLPEDRVPDISFDDSLRYATAVSCALHAMQEK